MTSFDSLVADSLFHPTTIVDINSGCKGSVANIPVPKPQVHREPQPLSSPKRSFFSIDRALLDQFVWGVGLSTTAGGLWLLGTMFQAALSVVLWIVIPMMVGLVILGALAFLFPETRLGKISSIVLSTLKKLWSSPPKSLPPVKQPKTKTLSSSHSSIELVTKPRRAFFKESVAEANRALRLKA
jgi:hypothetical protein